MKKQLIYILLLLLSGTMSLKSQPASRRFQSVFSTVDSLCAGRYTEWGHDIVDGIYLNKIERNFSIDSDPLKPLSRKYMKQNYSSSLTGWYRSYIVSYEFMLSPPKLPGIVLLKEYDPRDAYGILAEKSHFFSYSGFVCFWNGVPCCRWTYKVWTSTIHCPDGLRRNLSDSIFLNVEIDFKDGLMHGEYIVKSTDKGRSFKPEVIYETTFENGTGYYKDFFPDGTLRMEGAVKEGYADGLWRFYIYGGCDEYTGVILAEYKNGERLSQQEFFSKEEVDKQIREAIEKKEAERKRKRNIFSFLKKKKVRSIY